MHDGFVYIPRGKFFHGCKPNDNLRKEFELDYASMYLSDFFIQEFPVTVTQWQQFLDESHYSWKADADSAVLFPLAVRDGFRFVDNHPITFVSWNDAVAYCNWLSSVIDSGEFIVSLPTQFQWEKACRGTQGQKYPWGSRDDVMWEECNRVVDLTCIDVNRFSQLASCYGVKGMFTNVKEWCIDGMEASEDLDAEARVIKGGSMGCPGDCRCCYRYFYHRTYRDYCLGFRVVLNPST